jgi:hypothetical protein
MSEQPNFTAGPLSIYISDEPQDYWSQMHQVGGCFYVLVDLGSPGAELDRVYQSRNGDAWRLLGLVQQNLKKSGFVTFESFKHDYFAEERVLPISVTKKDGTPADRSILNTMVALAVANFESQPLLTNRKKGVPSRNKALQLKVA